MENQKQEAGNRPLTDKAVEALKPAGGKSYKKSDLKSPGLYVEVYATGKKYWRFRYWYHAKEKRISLGFFPEVGVKEAREAAADCRRDLRDGLDPAQKRLQPKGEVTTFRMLAEEWASRFLVEPQKAPSTIKRDKLIINKYIIPGLGDRPAKEITPQVMLGFLGPLVGRGTLEAASRARTICSHIFQFAIVAGQAERDPTQDIRGALPAPINNHYPAITKPGEVRGLLKAVWAYQGSLMVGLAMKMLFYVFTRPGELRQAKWEEFDLKEGLWRLPAARMKMRHDHLVPLARQVIELLGVVKNYGEDSPYLFPSRCKKCACLSDGTLNKALRKMGYPGDVMTAHGFRSLASTILNERGYNPDWIEAQLAHKDTNSIRAIYNRAVYLPERRQMMQDWADYLDGLREGEG